MKLPEKPAEVTGRWPLKAYDNYFFLHSPEGRGVRVLCEFEEPATRFRYLRVKNTIVFFGSARTLPPDKAKENLTILERGHKGNQKETRKGEETIEQAKRDLQMSIYYDHAQKLSHKLTKWSMSITEARKKFYICSGGGPGIMEAANRGAKEAGGKFVGLNISLPQEQDPNLYQTQEMSFEFHYFFIRKFWFFYLSKAMVVFPGGFGTMDEFFELLTLVQTRKTKKHMPIVLYGSKYWNELVNFKALVKWGMINKEDLSLFKICDTVESAFDYLTGELKKTYL